MIISNIVGGLGNQMFQYAAGRALSARLGVNQKLDLRNFIGYELHQGFELGRLFECKTDIATEENLIQTLGWQRISLIQRFLRKNYLKKLRRRSFVVEPTFNYWNGINDVHDNSYIIGNWQTEKYFIEFSDLIRNDFTFKLPLSYQNNKIANQISSVNAVSLHVRRGDYVTNSKNRFIGTCSLGYYQKAIELIRNKVQKPVFFIFSDDIGWVKENLRVDNDAVLVTHNIGCESYNDMCLMSMCKHHIIANSSFSWWGAWLNKNPNKIVIAPEKWFATNTLDTSDLLPSAWYRVNA